MRTILSSLQQGKLQQKPLPQPDPLTRHSTTILDRLDAELEELKQMGGCRPARFYGAYRTYQATLNTAMLEQLSQHISEEQLKRVLRLLIAYRDLLNE